ncbi:uncharacterized protein At4g04980-like [Arachis ipaensis]|uniref:uncharacterized protein At4g04980-like n=1 Tax=Arachis ipaensis TaxID=130454 RepID=UPI000A2B549C|nr:uncharacterized protein At4g04980-like [Arachis ipaensis]
MSSVELLAQWVDVTVLGEEPFVDTDFITNLRTHHRICASDEDEPKYELAAPEMVKKASASSYQKVQDAKKRSRARVDAARTSGDLPPPPPPHNLGTSSCPIMVSSSSTSSLPSPPPPPRPSPEPKKKKRKTSGSSSGAAFDGPQFV